MAHRRSFLQLLLATQYLCLRIIHKRLQTSSRQEKSFTSPPMWQVVANNLPFPHNAHTRFPPGRTEVRSTYTPLVSFHFCLSFFAIPYICQLCRADQFRLYWVTSISRSCYFVYYIIPAIISFILFFFFFHIFSFLCLTLLQLALSTTTAVCRFHL